MERKGAVIFFGKTGEGKSTVANALVVGGIDNNLFPVSDGLVGCTSEIQEEFGRGWKVIDTVGLGEADGGTVDSKEADGIILKFLKRMRGEYSHIVYVKSAESRFDVLDDQIWQTFVRIFKGADEAFTILFTKGTDEWRDVNFASFPAWAKKLGPTNILTTNLPPWSDKPAREKENKVIREESVTKLENDLTRLFQLRGSKYFVPDISKMKDEDLEEESKSILRYIKDFIKSLLPYASVGTNLTAMATGLTTILSALCGA